MSEAAALASGKGAKDENFPVASWLVAPRHRPVILAFYAFARLADDIADHPTVTAETKLARLEAMRASLTGEAESEPVATRLRAMLAEAGLGDRHALDLLEAFRRDVTRLRYADWDGLYDYCTVSAMPVGRFVLDVHGEDRRLWPASDALCAALQVINHLQDCGKDYRALDRVYVPLDLLAAAGAEVADLGRPEASPGLRRVIVELAARCDALLDRSAGFSAGIRDRRLGTEVAVIQRLARSLTARLMRRDPLSERVHHGKAEAALLALSAALPRLVRR
ncbi:squalene synthase HpnC [Sphingomonas morindae]|uniref:Squalene synthase HpnC n=1 Tax=Sphingomonas morindae TaxID=1541170 RepID=A0ABY4X455_9SPHN|nr:squalene synthase HpnC [Sphingomonas morindae]USI71665.1 squalene synthase HpnC [Sphingomonas morindae]